jgi:ABC-type arginine/histidine transport system permease subunit
MVGQLPWSAYHANIIYTIIMQHPYGNISACHSIGQEDFTVLLKLVLQIPLNKKAQKSNTYK